MIADLVLNHAATAFSCCRGSNANSSLQHTAAANEIDDVGLCAALAAVPAVGLGADLGRITARRPSPQAPRAEVVELTGRRTLPSTIVHDRGGHGREQHLHAAHGAVDLRAKVVVNTMSVEQVSALRLLDDIPLKEPVVATRALGVG
ncbi:hypothetical protein GQ600_15070 [Phytophthora cactorum]|nr:hypothetical protein GQ600_15070 [Phytophthora cactorum]